MCKPILFSPGEIFATQGAVNLGINLMPYLFRHLTGDWGELDEFDRQQNDLAVRDGYNGPRKLDTEKARNKIEYRP
jgi:hypothetical protein